MVAERQQRKTLTGWKKKKNNTGQRCYLERFVFNGAD